MSRLQQRPQLPQIPTVYQARTGAAKVTAIPQCREAVIVLEVAAKAKETGKASAIVTQLQLQRAVRLTVVGEAESEGEAGPPRLPRCHSSPSTPWLHSILRWHCLNLNLRLRLRLSLRPGCWQCAPLPAWQCQHH
jgi:hypothetical protein